jgi:hypothetical protein
MSYYRKGVRRDGEWTYSVQAWKEENLKKNRWDCSVRSTCTLSLRVLIYYLLFHPRCCCLLKFQSGLVKLA